MRMWIRRSTLLNNAFSKKLDKHIHALALYFAFYNFCLIHRPLPVSPALAAGSPDRLSSLDDIVAKIDELAAGPETTRALQEPDNVIFHPPQKGSRCDIVLCHHLRSCCSLGAISSLLVSPKLPQRAER